MQQTETCWLQRKICFSTVFFFRLSPQWLHVNTTILPIKCFVTSRTCENRRNRMKKPLVCSGQTVEHRRLAIVNNRANISSNEVIRFPSAQLSQQLSIAFGDSNTSIDPFRTVCDNLWTPAEPATWTNKFEKISCGHFFYCSKVSGGFFLLRAKGLWFIGNNRAAIISCGWKMCDSDMEYSDDDDLDDPMDYYGE